jgi:hypothetical protein
MVVDIPDDESTLATEAVVVLDQTLAMDTNFTRRCIVMEASLLPHGCAA